MLNIVSAMCRNEIKEDKWITALRKCTCLFFFSKHTYSHMFKCGNYVVDDGEFVHIPETTWVCAKYQFTVLFSKELCN